MLWWHVAVTNQFVCSGEFCENFCRCNRILSPQQVAQIQSDLIFCYLLQRQNSVTETKIFTKILQYTRSDLSLRCAPHLVAATSHLTCTHGVICHRDVLLQLVAWCVPTFNVQMSPSLTDSLRCRYFEIILQGDTKQQGAYRSSHWF